MTISSVSRCRKFLIALSCAVFIAGSAPVFACEPHWIQSVYECGEVIQLEDHSLWEVHGIGTGLTSDWKAGENVMVCEDKHMKKIRNTDKGPANRHWVYVEPVTATSDRNYQTDDCAMKKPSGQKPAKSH